MADCASDPGVEKESGTEGRNEGKSAAYDTESNPAISCTPRQSCAALSIYGNGIYTKGNPGLMDQGRDRNSFVLTSGKRLARRVGFLDEPSILRGESNHSASVSVTVRDWLLYLSKYRMFQSFSDFRPWLFDESVCRLGSLWLHGDGCYSQRSSYSCPLCVCVSVCVSNS